MSATTTVRLVAYRKIEREIPRALKTLQNLKSLGEIDWLGHRGPDGKVRRDYFVRVDGLYSWLGAKGISDLEKLDKKIGEWSKEVTWSEGGAV